MGEPSFELFAAAQARDTRKVSSLVGAHPELVNAKDPTGLSVLMTAIYHDAKDVVALLLRMGSSVDVFAAAALGDVPRLQAQLGAAPELVRASSADGWTPLHLAARFGKVPAVEALLRHDASVAAQSTNALANQPLHAAVAGGSAEVVRTLLAHGADANARQHGGGAPVHGAAASGRVDILHALIAAGADVKARTDAGQTAFGMAFDNNREEAVDLLRQLRANL